MNIREYYTIGVLLRVVGIMVASIIPTTAYFVNAPLGLPVSELVMGTLLGSCFFVFGLFIDIKNKHSEIKEELTGSLKDVHKILSENIYQTEILDKKELYEKMALEVKKAKESIYLTTLQIKDPREADEEFIAEYQNLMDEITRSEKVALRRIITVPNGSKLNWVDDLLNQYRGNKKLRIRYIDTE